MSIWPGLPAAARCAEPVTLATAERVIAVFSRPGDLVAAFTGSTAAIEASTTAGRYVVGFTPTDVGDTRVLVKPQSRPHPLARPLARMRTGGPTVLLAANDPDASQATFAITGRRPSWPASAGDDPEPGLLYAACERVLRPGGVLAAIIATPDPENQAADLAGEEVALARAAGFIYAQHIVLVHTAIWGDQFAPVTSVAAAAAPPGGSRVHSDLLIFIKPGGSARHD